MSDIRVLVADDHAVLRATVVRFLSSVPGVVVVAEASNGREAVAGACSCSPDLVLLDGNMPAMNGYDASRSIKAMHPHTRVAIVSVSQDEAYTRSAEMSQADVFIPKSSLKSSLHTLLQSLRELSEDVAVETAA